MKLSIIIPAYNAVKVIDSCLNSIFSLTLSERDFEVIVIDDCSNDNTIQVVESYAEQHNNITLLKQSKNSKQGAARNRGIKIAKGEYIAFVDADDEIVSDGMIKAINAVEKSKVDICYFDFEYEMPSNTWNRFYLPKGIRNRIISSFEYLNSYYTCYFNAPWRTLYRTKFLNDCSIYFEENVRWEDCDWTVKVYARAKEIQFVEGVGYRYVWNSSSTSRSTNTLAVVEQLKAGVRLISFAREIRLILPGLSKTLLDEAEYRYIKHNIRLRNLTKYNIVSMTSIYKLVSDLEWNIMMHVDLSRWETMVVKYHLLTLVVLTIMYPFATIGRKMVALKRKLL